MKIVYRLRTFLLACMLGGAVCSFAQTAGISEVNSVESKARTINANKTTIEKYRQELLQLEDAWQKKLQALKEELSALYKERDALISDMKVGAKCSQCGKYKSQFEKEGIDFQKHLGEVKGYAVPATTAELEAVRKQFTERIALKKVQIQNFEQNGDKNIQQKKTQLRSLEEMNTRLCNEITAHSKTYDKLVFDEAKRLHASWLDDLLQVVSAKLVAEDRITICKARKIRYQQQFEKEAAGVREKVKEEVESEKEKKKAKLTANTTEVEQIKEQLNANIDSLQPGLGNLQQERIAIMARLRTKISDSLRAVLQKDLENLNVSITSLEGRIAALKKTARAKITKLEAENKAIDKEIWQLTTDLSKKQDAAVALIKPKYDSLKKLAGEEERKAMLDLAYEKKRYTEKWNFYLGKKDEHYQVIDGETTRMVIAAQSVKCPVHNEVRGKVAGNWNSESPCVTAIASMAKPYSTNVFNSYCKQQRSTSFLSGYKAFLRSLDADDLAAVQANSNSNWFETVMNN